MTEKQPVGLRAARVQRRGAIFAAVLVAAASIYVAWWSPRGDHDQKQSVSNATVHGPVVQAGRDVILNDAPRVADVEAGTSSPLRITAYIASQEPYPDGLDFAGISWRRNYVDVRIDVTNGVDRLIDDVNLIVELDTHIAGLAQVNGVVPDLTITPVDQRITPLALGNDEISMPILADKRPDAQLAKQFRIVIPRLAAGVPVHLLVVAANVNPPGPGGEMPMTLFGPRRLPVAGVVEGTYGIPDPAHPQRVHVLAPLRFGDNQAGPENQR